MTATAVGQQPRTVVGIDPSLRATGIAAIQRDRFGDVDPKPQLWTLGRPGHREDTWEIRSRRIATQARDVVGKVRVLHPQLVVMEGPAYRIDLPSAFDRAGVWWGVFSGLHANRIPIAICNPQTRAMWATGKGNADKATVLTAIRGLWPTVTIGNDNEGDALVMAHAGAQYLGWLEPEELQHEPALSKIRWPKGA